MRTLLRVVSLLGLALTVLPPMLAFGGHLSQSASFTLMNVGMVSWFGTAVFWIKGGRAEDE
jgi:hypothetical protein